MKKLTYFILFTVILTIFSCNNFYSEHQSVSNLKWYKEDIKSFEVNIEEDGIYDFIFAIRYATGFPYRTMKIKITQKSNDSIETSQEKEFEVVDKNNNYIGEVAGELWDLETICIQKLKVKQGNYIYTLEHEMKSNPVIMVVDVGLIIKKIEIE